MKRVLQVGLGPLGQRIIHDMSERGVAHVVAAADTNPALAGQSLSKAVPDADPRIKIAPSVDAVTNWDEIDVAIVATSSDLAACADTLRTILRKGKPIVSTCEELVYPWLRHVGLAEELDELAKRHGGRVLGTGVNPGFLMDALPAFLTSVSR